LTAVTNTELLLNFQDSGIYDRTGLNNIDTVGDASLGFAPIYGTGMLAFDGTGDYLALDESERFGFGTGDFTVEAWAYTSDNTRSVGGASQRIFDIGGGDVGIWLQSSTGYISYNIAGGVTATTTVFPENQWNHVALTRSGTSLKLFLNGAQVASTTNSSNLGTAHPATVGAFNNTSDGAFLGYIDDLRITKGIARYTSAFTPPDEIDLSSDTHAEYVTLFLDGDGTPNGQNNTFTDSSTNGFTVTENGSVVQGVFSPYGDNWSNYFDGSGDGVSIATDSALDWGTSTDFTMECWFYSSVAVNSNTVLFDTRDTGTAASGVLFGINSSSKLVLVALNNFDITGTTSIEVGQWYHLVVVRNSGTFEVFINGVSEGTSSNSRNIQNTDGITVGGKQLSSTSYDSPTGYISNARVVSGTAVYTSAFTPSTTPLTAISGTSLLTCQSNRFVDESTNNHTVTVNGDTKVTRFSPFESNKPYDITTYGGSANFDSNEYLTIADNANLDVSGAMTAECWVYITDMPDSNIGNSGQGYLINRWTASGNQRSWAFLYGNNGDVALYISPDGGASYTISTATGALGTNRWIHVAASWDGTNQRLFIDGDLKVTTANASGPFSTASSDFTVNSINTSLTGSNINHYIADARYFNDAAIYTSSFTPPTAPLSATSGSDTAAVLLNFQDSAIPDLSGLNNIDTVGNAKVGASDPTKYGSNAMEFGGTTDRLITIGPDLLLGTGDFTIEFWVYFNSVSDGNIYTILDGRTTSDGTNVMWAQETSGSWTIFNGAGSGLASGWGSGTFTTGVWYHLAQTRESGVSRFFKDGTQTSGDLSDTSDYNSSTYSIGGRFAVGGYSLDGYIDDFRITKGIARYTSNFTAPDAALSKF
jgi:hypothetical protein